MIALESPDVQAAATAKRAVDDDLRSGDLIGAAVAPLASEWAPELAGRAQGAQDRRVLVEGATAVVDRAALILNAAPSTVALSGGLVPSELWPAVEFGSTRPGLPAKQPTGRVVIPTARDLGARYVAAGETAVEAAYRAAVGEE